MTRLLTYIISHTVDSESITMVALSRGPCFFKTNRGRVTGYNYGLIYKIESLRVDFQIRCIKCWNKGLILKIDFYNNVIHMRCKISSNEDNFKSVSSKVVLSHKRNHSKCEVLLVCIM